MTTTLERELCTPRALRCRRRKHNKSSTSRQLHPLPAVFLGVRRHGQQQLHARRVHPPLFLRAHPTSTVRPGKERRGEGGGGGHSLTYVALDSGIRRGRHTYGVTHTTHTKEPLRSKITIVIVSPNSHSTSLPPPPSSSSSRTRLLHRHSHPSILTCKSASSSS